MAWPLARIKTRSLSSLKLSVFSSPEKLYEFGVTTSKEGIEKLMNQTKSKMEKAAKELNFTEAARLRDEMFALQEKLNTIKKGA